MANVLTNTPTPLKLPPTRSARIRRARARYRRWRFCRPAVMRAMTWLIVAAAVNFTTTVGGRANAQTISPPPTSGQ
jgi:hypothetical protein